MISPAYGYFGSYCDTASGIVTTALLSDTTVSQLEDLAGTRYEQNRSYSGKVILGYTWYYAALVHAEDAKDFRLEPPLPFILVLLLLRPYRGRSRS